MISSTCDNIDPFEVVTKTTTAGILDGILIKHETESRMTEFFPLPFPPLSRSQQRENLSVAVEKKEKEKERKRREKKLEKLHVSEWKTMRVDNKGNKRRVRALLTHCV